ncbi:MAG: hypothetical protein KatS3mg105_1806 [Gemmatales bacterium]|nr:MAG: hypothetical protein KatS3mg105_1806 [Gemmatales bacterium]
MRILALVESIEHVCCRYRLKAFADPLAQAGYALEFSSFPEQPWGWFRLQRRLRDFQGVIVQRKLLHRWQCRQLQGKNRFLIFDFDDAVYARDSYSPKGIRSRRRQRRFETMIRLADAVVAGNEFLALHALQSSPYDHVFVIPTCVDPRRYSLAQHRSADNVHLVWIGSSSTLQGLERIKPMLDDLGRCFPNLRLKLICDRFFSLPNLQTVPHRWNDAEETTLLADSDIGISWIPDDEWSRGKCGLKILQYMAAGLPVVTNPVGVHGQLVQDGVHGYLANSFRDWKEALGRLASDPALRRRLGWNGRKRVERQYSVAVGSHSWLMLLEWLARKKLRRSA